MNILTINGEDLGIYVDSSLSFNKPEKSVYTYDVPGRNGSLIVDDGTWKNVLIAFPCFIRGASGSNFAAQFRTLINKLAPLKGYQRIECSWDPTHYRLGRVIVPLTPDPTQFNRDGFFELSFDCKPQMFLKTGETAQPFTATGSITNPTPFIAQPLLRVYGSGSVTIGGTMVTVSDNSGTYTDIDCEMMDCFRGTANRNAYVTFSGNDFPVLEAGANAITFGAGITQVEVTPRWWEL